MNGGKLQINFYVVCNEHFDVPEDVEVLPGEVDTIIKALQRELRVPVEALILDKVNRLFESKKGTQ